MLVVDTGVLLAAADRTDRDHDACLELVETTTDTMVTTALVVAETGYLIERQLGTTAEASVYRSIAHGDLTVEVLTTSDVQRIAALVETLDEAFPPGHRVLIFGTARDKDVAGMLRQLLPRFEHVILTQFMSNPRALPVVKLMEVARQVADELSPPVASLQSDATPEQAWRSWLQRATPESLVCITGSFFLAAEFQHGLSAWPNAPD